MGIPTCKKNLSHWLTIARDELNCCKQSAMENCWVKTHLPRAWEDAVQREAISRLSSGMDGLFPKERKTIVSQHADVQEDEEHGGMGFMDDDIANELDEEAQWFYAKEFIQCDSACVAKEPTTPPEPANTTEKPKKPSKYAISSPVPIQLQPLQQPLQQPVSCSLEELKAPLSATEEVELIWPEAGLLASEAHFDELVYGPAEMHQDILQDMLRLAVRPAAPATTIVEVRTTYSVWAEKSHEHTKNWQLTNTFERVLPHLGDPASPVAKLLLLIHRRSEGHWTMGVLDVRRAQFSYLDSWNPRLAKAKSALQPLKLWFDAKAPQQIPWHQDLYLVPARGVIPKQYGGANPNDRYAGVDCGIFAILFALAECQGVDLRTHPFCQQDVETMRKRLGLTLVRALQTEFDQNQSLIEAEELVEEEVNQDVSSFEEVHD